MTCKKKKKTEKPRLWLFKLWILALLEGIWSSYKIEGPDDASEGIIQLLDYELDNKAADFLAKQQKLDDDDTGKQISDLSDKMSEMSSSIKKRDAKDE